ncbi:MAG: hypothetical protein QNJ45_13145 [Ardenticatenaceae bacterium]|nr:hypothetical protein [Ardenticatenaceae bacterium]
MSKKVKNLYIVIGFFLLAACSPAQTGPEPAASGKPESAEEQISNEICTNPTNDWSIGVFPQNGRELLINGFDLPAGSQPQLLISGVTNPEAIEQITRSPIVGDDGMFSETVTLPKHDYMRWNIRLFIEEEVICHYVITGHDGWLEMGYDGPRAADSALREDMALAAEQTGIPVEELEAQAANEDAISELQARLRANEADTYSGLWLDWEPYRVIVSFTTAGGEETVAKYLAAASPLWDYLEFRTGIYTQEQLLADQQALNQLLKDANFEWNSATIIQKNRVELIVPTAEIWQAFVAENPVKLPPSIEVNFSFTSDELLINPPTNLNPLPDIFLAQLEMPSLNRMAALLNDPLLIEDGCVFAGTSGNRQLIIWQPGYFVHNGVSAIEILDQDGNIVATEGQPLYMGGGEGRLRDEVNLSEAVPDRCRTERVWYMGEFLPEEYRPEDEESTAPEPVNSAADSNRQELQQLITDVLHRYNIDPDGECFDLQASYEEYHPGLQEMVAILLTHPKAQSFSFDEREEIFYEVAGFEHLKFTVGNDSSVLVAMPTNFGHKLGCGGRRISPRALFVVDPDGRVTDIGGVSTGGKVDNVWLIDDRWVVTINTNLDTSSGTDPWAVWHIGLSNDGWERIVAHEFFPRPYISIDLPLSFTDGYQTMVAEFTYWPGHEPCKLSESFREAYTYGAWKTLETFALVDNTYERIAFEVVEFPVLDRNTKEEVTLSNWQDYCNGPLEPGLSPLGG